MSLSTAGVTNISEKLTAGIVDTGDNFTASVTAIVSANQGNYRSKNDTGGAPCVADIVANFKKKVRNGAL
jgi:hypothetical protein